MRLTELLGEARNLRAELEALDSSGKSTQSRVFVHAHLVGAHYRAYPKRKLKKPKTAGYPRVFRLVGGGKV